MQNLHCNTCNHDYESYSEAGTRPPCTKCNSHDIVFRITAPAIKVTGQGAYTQKMKV